MKKDLYYVPNGSGRWQDVACWSRETGGSPAGVWPSIGDVVVLDENSGTARVDLRGVVCGGYRISGFKGTLVTPQGGTLDLTGRKPRKRDRIAEWLRITKAPTPVMSRFSRDRLLEQGWTWQMAVRMRLATLHGPRLLFLTAGNPSIRNATITASATGGNWSATGTWVGGVVPGSGDAVLLASTSGNVVVDVASACASLDAATGLYTGTLSGSATLSCGGNFKLVAGMTLSYTGTLTFVNTSGTATLTCAGKTFGALTVNGAGGTTSFADTNAVTNAMTLMTGTLNTTGQTCTWGSFTGNFGTTKTLTPGASSIAVTSSGGNNFLISNGAITVTANTAIVTLSGASAGFNGNTNLNGMSIVFTGGGAMVLSNTNTGIRNLTVTGSISKTDSLSVNGNNTVTGTFTLNSNSATNRLLVQSGTVGTARTITAGSLVCTNVVDFMDIVGAGTATWTTGASGATAFGDCGGNSGITFTPGLTGGSAMSVAGASGWTWSTATWVGRAFPPLPQDDVAIANAFSATQTVTADMPRLGRSISFTGATGSPTLALGSTANSIFGSLTLVSGMGRSGTQNMTFAGRSSYTITMNGVTFAPSWTVNAPSGTYALGSDLLGASGGMSGTLNVTNGTFDAVTYNVTINNVSTSTGTTLKFGSATWTFPGTSANPVIINSGTTVVAGTAVIALTDTSTAKTFAGGGKTFPTLQYKASGSGSLTFTGNNTFATLDLECTTARVIALPASGTQTVTSAFTRQGATGQLLSFVSSSPGTATTIVLNSGATETSSFNTLSSDVTIDLLFTVSIGGIGSLTATVTPYQRITASVAGVGTLAATVTPYQRITASITGTGALSAALIAYQRFTATLAGVGSLTATVTPYQRITAALTGSSALTAVVTPFQRIVAALTGQGTLTATVTPFKYLTASLTGVGTITAAVTPTKMLAVSITGTGTLSASLVSYQRITVTLAGTSSVAVIFYSEHQVSGGAITDFTPFGQRVSDASRYGGTIGALR